MTQDNEGTSSLSRDVFGSCVASFPRRGSTRPTAEERAWRFRTGSAPLVVAAAMMFLAGGAHATDTNELDKSIRELKQLPFEELVGLQVTSVSRRPERLVEAASAVQVLTDEDVRRSGASSLPEALRLAPNLQVAQIDSRQWAISSRGFNSSTADKLLVLIDGRSVYTPLFSGVFWDVQNVMLEDLDRIEVISGPGATLWGANAVNGVINVISKSADQTQGTLVSAGGGSFLRDFASVRYGDKIGEDVFFRVYGTGFQREATLSHGHDATNDWGMGQFGFRGDWLPKQGDKVTFQGDFYGADMGQPSPGDTTVNGQNLVGRWTHPFAPGSEMTVQTYWDRTWRKIPNVFAEELNTFDIDLQDRFPLGDRQNVIWGLGYRLMADHVNNTPALAFLPASRNLQLVSAFLQDDIVVVEDRLFLTLGSKFEHNDYSGFEIQPSGRVSFIPATNHTIWAAVSRAVRSPSRIDTEFFVPGTAPYVIRGGQDRFDSEKLIAYELGYRAEVTRRIGLSLSTFFNDYDDVRSVEPIPGKPGQFIILNGLRAEAYGAELSGTWQVLESWRLRGGYTWFQKHVLLDGSSDINHGTGEGNDPHHQFVVQSMLNLPHRVEFDSVLRYVDNLDQRGPTVPAYFALDLRAAWHINTNVEVSVVGQNLLDDRRPEFGTRSARQEIPRGVYGKVTWRF